MSLEQFAYLVDKVERGKATREEERELVQELLDMDGMALGTLSGQYGEVLERALEEGAIVI